MASALALQCSTSLSYEDPYTGGRPIYWVHQPVKGMKHRMKWCELRQYKWNEYVTIAVNRNLSNCEKARKKGFRSFNGIRTRGLCVSAAVLYQPELWRPIHWRPANILSSSTRERNETQNEMMWTAGNEMSMWIPLKLQNPFFRAFSQLLKLRFTVMVTYSFHLYSRSSHHFILCFIPVTGWWTQYIGRPPVYGSS